MSQVIERYLNECKDPALTAEHKTRLLKAIVPSPTGEMFTLSSSTSVSSSPLENTDSISESVDATSMPIVDVNKDVIQAIFTDLQKDGVNESTLYFIATLIQSEVHGELKLSNDEQVITALKFLKTCGYDSVTIEDCIQIINTPEDEDIPNPGASMQLMMECLTGKACSVLVNAVFEYLQESMNNE
jgi:hypothetical protein